MDFDRMTFEIWQNDQKYINWHISVNLQDIKMQFELSVTISKRSVGFLLTFIGDLI